MTSGTRERKQRRCWACGNVAWHNEQIAPEVCCKKCGSQDTRLVKEPTPTPPPLQPGDAVWVRAVVSKVDDVGRNRKRVEVDMAHVSSAGLLTSQVVCGVPLTAIRRIEGEVKP